MVSPVLQSSADSKPLSLTERYKPLAKGWCWTVPFLCCLGHCSVWLMMIQTFPGSSAAHASSGMPFDSKASEGFKWMENPPGDQMGCLLFVFVKQCLGT